MTPRCDGCKYWDFPRADEYSSTPKVLNECFKAQPLWNCSDYNLESDEWIRELKEEFKDLKLFVQDGSDYKAHMITAADFFCAHFEAK